ncbi:hypothetical protein X962_2021 [Burkholderia pseudomallei MSHR7343]|uniref:hypothetical protein n=1 Tax=Burkholderia pseudomallei TaxID=28450 RepID=UPI000530FFC2|nr:hypothetical protein [Burkholderia pseudomallei]KGS34477.1 hypothetical protein X962_2021 [Burkholderia pseudomallei MSHR7343]
MGLDATAYRQIKKIDCVFDADGEPIDPITRGAIETDYLRVYVNPDFPGRADDLENRAIYSYQDADEAFSGGYGRYSMWREMLAKLAGYQPISVDRFGTGRTELRHDEAAWRATSGPFWELICFSDCDGVIGSTVSAKLAQDFAQFDELAKANESFYVIYSQWRAAFEMAAQNGCVCFH